jgi:hypothetical protein
MGFRYSSQVIVELEGMGSGNPEEGLDIVKKKPGGTGEFHCAYHQCNAPHIKALA